MSGSNSEVALVDHSRFIKSTIRPIQDRFADHMTDVINYVFPILIKEAKIRREKRLAMLAAILGTVISIWMMWGWK